MFITNNLNGREGGFQMVFKNGWTVSVEWHEDAFSDEENRTAQIGAWDKDLNWFVFDEGKIDADTIKGYVAPEQVASFIKMISMLEGELGGLNDGLGI